MELTSEQEHEAWRASDPLWHQARGAMFDKLLVNPSTRDTVLQINIAVALKDGDTESAARLAERLSPNRFLELFGDLSESSERKEGDQP